MARIHLEVTDFEVAVAHREQVQIENDLFVAGVAVTTVAQPAAVDRVLPALFGALVVLVGTVGHGRRGVGLLHARRDLVVDPRLQRLGRSHDGVGVRVLGFEIRTHIGVGALAQPVPVVDALVAVGAQDVRETGRQRRARDLGLLGFRHGR